MNIADPVAELVTRTEAASVTMAEVCRRAKVAASTPSRWRSGVFEPKVRTVNRLNAALDSIIAEQAASQPVAE